MVVDPLDRTKDLAEVLRLHTLGYSAARIKDEIGRSHEYVQTLLREAAEDLQKRNKEHVDEAFMQQDAAIMHLYRRCIEQIEAAASADPPYFHEKAILCAIKLFERRSRLLGLDRDRGPTLSGKGFAWLDKAGPAELEKIARSYGIPVPVPFA